MSIRANLCDRMVLPGCDRKINATDLPNLHRRSRLRQLPPHCLAQTPSNLYSRFAVRRAIVLSIRQSWTSFIANRGSSFWAFSQNWFDDSHGAFDMAVESREGEVPFRTRPTPRTCPHHSPRTSLAKHAHQSTRHWR
ncbi:hypothetical protein Adt_13132 [Abeliophyllum distichum]|uniref:Uncharacterized protein n=1 Tax=Abeliophyllum distichum TaxID=126358 RepID=A0ABD1TVZ2_9LAMI